MKKNYELAQSVKFTGRKGGERLETRVPITHPKHGDVFTVIHHSREADYSNVTGLFTNLKLETFRKIKQQTAEVAGQSKILPHYLYMQIGTHCFYMQIDKFIHISQEASDDINRPHPLLI